MQPFGDILTDLDLTGDQIYTLLGQQWVGPDLAEDPGSVEGLHLYLQDNSKAGRHRARWSTAASCSMAWPSTRPRPIASKPTTYVADGGDDFTIMTQGKNLYTGPVDIDAFVAYLKANSPLTPAAPSRITRLD